MQSLLAAEACVACLQAWVGTPNKMRLQVCRDGQGSESAAVSLHAPPVTLCQMYYRANIRWPQGRIACFHWWLTYCILKAKKPAFQRMESPATTSTSDDTDAPSGNGADGDT